MESSIRQNFVLTEIIFSINFFVFVDIKKKKPAKTARCKIV